MTIEVHPEDYRQWKEKNGIQSIWQRYWVRYMFHGLTQKDNLVKWLAFSWKYQKIQKSNTYNTFTWCTRDVPICLGFEALWFVGFFVRLFWTLCAYRSPIMLFHNPHVIYVALKRSLTQLLQTNSTPADPFPFWINTPLLQHWNIRLVFGFCLMMLQMEQHSLPK